MSSCRVVDNSLTFASHVEYVHNTTMYQQFHPLLQKCTISVKWHLFARFVVSGTQGRKMARHICSCPFNITKQKFDISMELWGCLLFALKMSTFDAVSFVYGGHRGICQNNTNMTHIVHIIWQNANC